MVTEIHKPQATLVASLAVKDHMQAKAEAFQDRLVAFGVSVARIPSQMSRDVAGVHIAKQLVRSALSPAANYAEARDAESRPDFIHKCKVCIKELREADVWLRIARQLDGPRAEIDSAASECNQLIAILVTSVKTARSRLRIDGR